MTITRVGTNNKYSQGWGLAFGATEPAKESETKEAKATKKAPKAKKKASKKKK